jgi:pimeloyl-ACP methyl ester carboxylesterase
MRLVWQPAVGDEQPSADTQPTLSCLLPAGLLQGVDNYMLDVLASDVKGAVDALGHSSCTLVAHDWGGGVAWVTAGMYGSDLIKQLIVLGLPHLGISSTNMNTSQYLKSSYIMTFQVGGLQLWKCSCTS